MSWLQDVARTGGRLNVDASVRCAGAPRVRIDSPAPGFEAPVGEAGVTIGSSPSCSAWVSVPGLVQPSLFCRNGLFVDTKVLPTTGTYTILVDPIGADFGSATLTLHDVPPDVNAAISPGGAPVSVTTGPVPGQNAVLSFHGLAGQRVSLKMSDVSVGTSPCCAAYVSIPGVFPGALFGRNGLFVDTKVLPTTGTYTLFVDPLGAEVGSATVTLYDVPPDASASMSVGGSPVTVSAGSVPGQNTLVFFAGSAGQRVLLKASGVTRRPAAL